MTRRPNILLIVTDEERAVIPRPDGFSLPARERPAERGTAFQRFYSASAMCINDWGDIDGGAWAGLKIDPVIAGQAVRWLRNRAPAVAEDQPWFMAVNFVNPHDIMTFDYGGTPQVRLPFGLAHAGSPRRRPTSPSTGRAGTSRCPTACGTTCPARPRRWPSTRGCWTPSSGPWPTTNTGTTA